jgi:hypothetical protein
LAFRGDQGGNDLPSRLALSQVAGGERYDLTTVAELPDGIARAVKPEKRIEHRHLWNTWLFFATRWVGGRFFWGTSFFGRRGV